MEKIFQEEYYHRTRQTENSIIRERNERISREIAAREARERAVREIAAKEAREERMARI